MHLREFFPDPAPELDETPDDATAQELRRCLTAVDPGVGQQIGMHGQSSKATFQGSNGTVWQAMKRGRYGNEDELRRLAGQHTRCLVPVLRVADLPGDSVAFQFAAMQPLSPQEHRELMSAVEGAENLAYVQSSDVSPQASPRARQFFQTLFAELESHNLGSGIDLYGEENVMKDRSGTWRYIDVA